MVERSTRQQPVTMSELSGMAVEISNLYGFLAGLYRSEIQSSQLESLLSPEMKPALEAVGIDLSDAFWRRPGEQVVEDLAVEFTALFLGPGGHISPHESVQRESRGLYWGDSTLAVRRFIASTGIEYSAQYTGVPDHLSIELEFMAVLAQHEAKAWEDGDARAALNTLEYQQAFLEEHLGQWVGAFSAKVVEQAELRFYRDVAALTASFVASEELAVRERRLDANSYTGPVTEAVSLRASL